MTSRILHIKLREWDEKTYVLTYVRICLTFLATFHVDIIVEKAVSSNNF